MTRAHRVLILGAAILLAGAGCAARPASPTTATTADTVGADIGEIDAVAAETDAEDFSASTLDELDVTVEDDAADIDDAIAGTDPSAFDGSDLTDDALER